MCGLLAYLSTDTPRVTESRVDDVREALHCLHHRGPHDTAARSAERAVLRLPPPPPLHAARGAARLAAECRGGRRCLRHRGPDDTAVWSDESVVLGFNRLSIIDVEGSPQPLPYAGDRYRILFNGEIYNYVELREELAAAGAQLATPRDPHTNDAGAPHLGAG